MTDIHLEADPDPEGDAPPDTGDATAAAPTGEPTSHRARWTALAVGLAIVALIGVLAFGSDDQLDPASDVLGTRVPDVSGPTIDGGTYDIDNARGKWVIVNFFATWCPPCHAEHPDLVALDEWGRSTGKAEVVAVVFQDTVEKVEAFFAENGGGWPVLDNPSVPVAFQVSQIPETFLVAPSGQVVQHTAGQVDADAMIELIEELES